jgi:hypothetical protein
MNNRVHQLRLVVTAEDYDDALHFYRELVADRIELGAWRSAGWCQT